MEVGLPVFGSCSRTIPGEYHQQEWHGDRSRARKPRTQSKLSDEDEGKLLADSCGANEPAFTESAYFRPKIEEPR